MFLQQGHQYCGTFFRATNIYTVLSQSNEYIYRIFSIKRRAGGVYLKLGLVDPAFIRTRRLFGARRLFIECIFRPFSAIHFFIISTEGFQQKR